VAGGSDDAALLEALAARAWPARVSERVDGWLLRSTPSVRRRRLNSALPLGEEGAGLESVERFYRERGESARVQVAPAEAMGRLDAELDARGWHADGPTDILVAHELMSASPGGVQVALGPRVDRAWLDAWVAGECRRGAEETYAHVLSRIPSPVAFAVAALDGRPAGVGLAVCERG
jgi:hypothetical protein